MNSRKKVAPPEITQAARQAAYRDSGKSVTVILRGPAQKRYEAIAKKTGLGPTAIFSDLLLSRR